MKIIRFDAEAKEEWLEARRGKITGTRLKDLISKRSTEKKIGYYEIIAERLAIPADDEMAMERGLRLECDAIAEFEKRNNKKVDDGLVIWTRDDNENIALSPDAYTEDLKEAVEVKCLNSANHIKALLTQQIPKEYYEQALQYFIVNDELEVLYFVMYDPRILAEPYLQFPLLRKQVEEVIAEYLQLERETIDEIDEIVNRLSNF